MKHFLPILLLLTLLQYKANGQSLSLDQLIQIEKMQPLDRDAYLVKAGWEYKGTRNLNDTTYVAQWVFLGPINVVISRLEAVNDERESSDERKSTSILYTTMLRPPFDVIREAVVRYHMDMLYSEKRSMKTRYRGTRYDLTLGLENTSGVLPYWASVQRHAYVKGYRDNGDGTTTGIWIMASGFTPAQLKRFDTHVDSIEHINQKSRAEDQKPPTSKK